MDIEIADLVEAYLTTYCYGREKMTTSRIIEQQLGIDGFDLRQCVNLLRRQTVPIASESRGYFYATDARDLDATLHHLRHRLKGINGAIEGLEKAQRKLLGLP